MKPFLALISLMLTINLGYAQDQIPLEEGRVRAVWDHKNTVKLSTGEFKVQPRVLRQARGRLGPGTLVQYSVDYSNDDFPEGLITHLKPKNNPRPTCPPVCL